MLPCCRLLTLAGLPGRKAYQVTNKFDSNKRKGRLTRLRAISDPLVVHPSSPRFDIRILPFRSNRTCTCTPGLRWCPGDIQYPTRLINVQGDSKSAFQLAVILIQSIIIKEMSGEHWCVGATAGKAASSIGDPSNRARRSCLRASANIPYCACTDLPILYCERVLGRMLHVRGSDRTGARLNSMWARVGRCIDSCLSYSPSIQRTKRVWRS